MPDGIEYGTDLLVEFQPDSLWYETSLTIAANALRAGIGTEYHTFMQPPSEIKKALSRLGLDVVELLEKDALRIIDSYTVQTGVGVSETPAKVQLQFPTQSLKLSDWSIDFMQLMKRGVPESEKRRLHIDDNLGVLLQYNDEKTLIDFYRTRLSPIMRIREGIGFSSLLMEVGSNAFRNQFEMMHQGVIDFKSEEEGDHIEHFVRIRIMRGRTCNSRWRRLRILNNGEVTVSE